jgi:proteasome lid subunit RPN8/RPN11
MARNEPVQIVLYAAASNAIAREAARALPLETGGVLLGHREGDDVVVTEVLVVNDASATRRRYVRDDAQANALLRDYLAARGDATPTGYVGEWHSHTGNEAPSTVDMGSIRATAKGAKGPIALLVCVPEATPPVFQGIVARQRRFGRISTEQASVEILGTAVSLPALPEGAVRGDGPIFISYRQSDGTERASAIESLLRCAGLVVWRDRTDLRAGTTTDRLNQALTGGLSGAVLVVTPDIANSSIIPSRELPLLLQLDEDPAFSLCIGNDISDANDESKADYRAPDVLLGRPDSALAAKKQSNSRTEAGRLEIVRDLLLHRIEQVKEQIRARGHVITIVTQTRPEPSAADAGQADLHIRIKPAERGRLPSGKGLGDLRQTLPITSDAIFASSAQTVRISGGMHLSVALAIGAALPETRVGNVEVVDLRGELWSSRSGTDPGTHHLETEPLEGNFKTERKGLAKIAVFLTFTANADESAFRRLLDETPGVFNSAVRIGVDTVTPIEAGEASRLSVEAGREVKRLSAESGRAEIHLAFHGPYTLAFLIARFLNTTRVVVYEWDNDEAEGPRYYPVLVLEPGVAKGPITDVLLSEDHARVLP